MVISSNNFKENDASSMHLFVLVFEKEIHAIVFDPVKKTVEAFDKVSKLENLGFLSESFADVKIVIVNEQFTLVPEALFDSQAIDSYFEFAIEKSNELHINHEAIVKFDVHVVWGIDQQLRSELIQQWPGCSITHLVTQKLNSVNESQSQNSLFVDTFPNIISVLFFSKNELQLCNLYPTQSVQDALYYSLVALDRANMEPKDIDAYFSISADDKKMVNTYFPNYIDAATSANYKCELPITASDKISCSLL